MQRILQVLFALMSASAFAANTTIEKIKTPFLIRNQGGTALCWLHSGLQMMEQMAAEPLSIDALLIPEIRSRAVDRFLNYETPWDGGAGPTRPFALALQEGLVPESVWKSRTSIVQNYHTIFSQIEKLLTKYKSSSAEQLPAFLRDLDQILLGYLGSFPPTSFQHRGQRISTVDFAKTLIGKGDSLGYDFRNVQYDDSVFGRMAEIPWTTIADKSGQLIPITSLIAKTTIRTDAETAFAKAVQAFDEGRPVGFTFIYSIPESGRTFQLNERREFVSAVAPAQSTYTSSHLVLVSGVVRENGTPIALTVLDPLVNGERTVTYEFFTQHGKTIHLIGEDCTELLQ
jgi:hypothetical protein